jgi:hypothetical protein
MVLKIFRFLFLSILLFFALIGTLFFQTIWHEHSHFKDYEHLREEFEDDGVCIISVDPENMWSITEYVGYYYFNYRVYDDDLNYKQDLVDEIERIAVFTELKAYTKTAIVLIVFLISIGFFFDLLFKNQSLKYQNKFLWHRLEQKGL